MPRKRIRNKPQLERNRKRLRNHPTPAEALLWKCLRRGLMGYKFRRQFSIGGYVMDFYCPAKKLGVEADGVHHSEPEQMAYDNRRTWFLKNKGVRLLRFENGEVLMNTDLVLEAIRKGLAT